MAGARSGRENQRRLCLQKPHDAAPLNLPAILALNNAHAAATSWLSPGKLDAMLAAALHVGLVDGGQGGFLLAFDQDAAYDSPNFLWFRARHRRFAYIDRVVVAPALQRRGHGKALYAGLIAAAAGPVCCEVNRVPPNPASDAFHAALGFQEVGQAEHPDGKVVRYLRRPLSAPARPPPT